MVTYRLILPCYVILILLRAQIFHASAGVSAHTIGKERRQQRTSDTPSRNIHNRLRQLKRDNGVPKFKESNNEPQTIPIATSRISPTDEPAPIISTVKPTAGPTYKSCGNDICEDDETATICSDDCSNVTFTASESGTKGAVGIMFSVKALRDVVVTSFNFYVGKAAQDAAIQVYTRRGTYNGFEFLETGWELVNDKIMDTNTRVVLTQLDGFATHVSIPAGGIQSFFLYTPNKLMYEVGTTGGALFSADNALELYEGIGKTTKFEGSATDIAPSRIFRGEIL